jgi:hypothetical protein
MKTKRSKEDRLREEEFSPALHRMKQAHEKENGNFFRLAEKHYYPKHIFRAIYPCNFGRYIIEQLTNLKTNETFFHVYQFELNHDITLTEVVNCQALNEAADGAMKLKADRHEQSFMDATSNRFYSATQPEG